MCLLVPVKTENTESTDMYVWKLIQQEFSQGFSRRSTPLLVYLVTVPFIHNEAWRISVTRGN